MKLKYSILMIIEIFLIFLYVHLYQTVNTQVDVQVAQKKESERLKYEKKLPDIKLAYKSCAKEIYELTGRIAPKVGTPEFDEFINAQGFRSTNKVGSEVKFIFSNILENSYGPSRFSGLYDAHYDYRDPDRKSKRDFISNYVYVNCTYYIPRKRVEWLTINTHAETAHGRGQRHFKFIDRTREEPWKKLKQDLRKQL